MDNKYTFAARALGLLGAIAGLTSVSAQTPVFKEYPIPTAGSYPLSTITGPDGNLWFTELYSEKIGKVSTAGVVTEFPLPAGRAVARAHGGMARGPDGNIWFTEMRAPFGFTMPPAPGNIDKITPAGVIAEYPLPSGNTPGGIANGSDGNLWFTELNSSSIGKITPTGVITEFPGRTTGHPQAIVSGPDGNLWFTEYEILCGTDFCTASKGMIGKITPAGVVTEFPVPTAISFMYGITTGPDGNLWFTESQGGILDAAPSGGKIAKITPAGAITEYATPTTGGAPAGIVTGPDGNLWFTESNRNNIGKITPSGVITEYAIPSAGSGPQGIAAGPDGNLWFAESNSNQISKLVIGTGITISAGFTGNWFDTSEGGHGFSIEVLPGNQMLAQWYVFAPNGGQSWIVATGPITGNTAVLQGFQPVGSGGRFPPNFNSSQLQNQPWGSITFTFTDCNNGTVSWQPTATGYTSGSIPITRLTMPAGLTCP